MKKHRYGYLTENDRKIRNMRRAIIILSIACAALAAALAAVFAFYILVPRIIA